MVRSRRGGQSTVETMLYISVISIALVALAWIAFGTDFSAGFQQMDSDTRDVFQQGIQTGSNDRR